MKNQIINLVDNLPYEDIDSIYAALKERTRELDVKASRALNIGLALSFYSPKYGKLSGHVAEIKRSGRVKVDLINSEGTFTSGAAWLKGAAL